MLVLSLLIFLFVFGVLAAVAVAATGGARSSAEAGAALNFALKLTNFSGREEVIDIRKDVTLSSVPWLNAILVRMRTVTELQGFLNQAGLSWTPGRLLITSALAWLIAAYLIAWRTGLGLPSIVLGAVIGVTPWLYVLRKRRARFKRFEQGLPDALDLMVSALRGGHSAISALGIVADEAPDPIGRELRLCFEEQNFGLDLRSALNNLVRRVPLQDLRMVTIAMIIQKESGGNLAEVLDKTAEVIRDRFRILQQIRVHTAQGRLTGWILSLLPVGLAIVMAFVNPSHIGLLFSRPLGHRMIWAGCGLNVLGMLIIRKIVAVRI